MRLIVTRPAEDAAPLKRKLEALGHSVVLAPLLTVVPVADAVVPDRAYQLVAFTSSNGARSLARHASIDRLRKLPAFAVGRQSAEAARLAGFTDVSVAGGDAIGLADHLARRRQPDSGAVLYPSGRDTAGDFAGRLGHSGFEVVRVIVYEALPRTESSAPAHDADGVLLYSPRSARLWHAATMSQTLAGLVHFCLSHNVAAALPETHVKRIAASPTEEAMLALVAEEFPPSRSTRS